MLARIRRSMEDKDQGFTLIELLVVMIIIGILAAIAVPVFMNQRKKAVDASIKADLRTLAANEETAFSDNQTYYDLGGTAGAYTINGTSVKTSSGNTFTVVGVTSANAKAASTGVGVGFCLTGSNDKATSSFTYNSVNGGLSTTTCPS